MSEVRCPIEAEQLYCARFEAGYAEWRLKRFVCHGRKWGLVNWDVHLNVKVLGIFNRQFKKICVNTKSVCIDKMVND